MPDRSRPAIGGDSVPSPAGAAHGSAPGGLTRVRKPARVRALGKVDTEALRSRVARLSERVWRQEDSAKENVYPFFSHTRHIIFRFIAGNRDPRRFYSMPIWTVWRPWLLDVMAAAAAPYRFTDPVYPKAMLARLEAGHAIGRHTDGRASEPFVHKIHVPLETNGGALMHVDGENFHLQAGHAWEINNMAPHGAVNRGKTDRIHLIFEVFDGAGIVVNGAP